MVRKGTVTLTDITVKLNNLYCELQGKGKTISEMISAINAFKAKISLFSTYLQRKKLHHFPLMLRNNDSASEVFDRALHNYFELLKNWARI